MKFNILVYCIIVVLIIINYKLKYQDIRHNEGDYQISIDIEYCAEPIVPNHLIHLSYSFKNQAASFYATWEVVRERE